MVIAEVSILHSGIIVSSIITAFKSQLYSEDMKAGFSAVSPSIPGELYWINLI